MSDKNDETQVIGFQITAEELAIIDALARRAERSRSAEIRMALRLWFERNGVSVKPKTA